MRVAQLALWATASCLLLHVPVSHTREIICRENVAPRTCLWAGCKMSNGRCVYNNTNTVPGFLYVGLRCWSGSIPWDNIGSYNSLQECAHACLTNPTCELFETISGSNRCYLMNHGCTIAHHEYEGAMYVKAAFEDYNCYTGTCETHPYERLRHLNDRDSTVCRDACDTTKDCTGFFYSPLDAPSCTLYNLTVSHRCDRLLRRQIYPHVICDKRSHGVQYKAEFLSGFLSNGATRDRNPFVYQELKFNNSHIHTYMMWRYPSPKMSGGKLLMFINVIDFTCNSFRVTYSLGPSILDRAANTVGRSTRTDLFDVETHSCAFKEEIISSYTDVMWHNTYTGTCIFECDPTGGTPIDAVFLRADAHLGFFHYWAKITEVNFL